MAESMMILANVLLALLIVAHVFSLLRDTCVIKSNYKSYQETITSLKKDRIDKEEYIELLNNHIKYLTNQITEKMIYSSYLICDRGLVPIREDDLKDYFEKTDKEKN